jgi:hypothetical protein
LPLTASGGTRADDIGYVGLTADVMAGEGMH